MGFCRSALCVLIFLLYLHRVVSAAAPDEKTVRAYLNDSAILPCSGSSCSGKLLWVKLQNSSFIVAWCDQSSCHPTEGFQISHHEYLKGNFSLKITAVNPNNTGSYNCQCGHKPLQEVLLQIISVPTVKVEFDGTAVLPCSENCSGLVTWVNIKNFSEVLAECDQTCCRSVKGGYQMIYNQYLQENLSLIITQADFSKSGTYTCECDGTDLCDVQLQIEPPMTQVHVNPGDSLLLELDILDPVEVIYQETGAANQTSHQICTVDRRSSQSTPPYTPRTSLSSALELRDMNKSDSGFYTIRDTNNKQDIHIYNVTVQEEHHSDGDKKDWVPPWKWEVVVAACGCLSGVVFVLLAVVMCLCKNDKHSCNERIRLQEIRPRANEEVSQNTEQDPLSSTDDSDN